MGEHKSKAVRLEQIDGFANKFRELMERWENRLVIGRQSLAKQYTEGRFTVILEFKRRIPWGNATSHNSLTFSESAANGSARYSPIFFPSGVFEIGACTSKPHHWDQELVFISNVQTVKGPDGVIPSWMGLYNIQQNRGNFRELIYYSMLNGLCKFLPAIHSGKVETPVLDSFAEHEIQSRSQVVNCISSDKRDFIWNGLQKSDCETMLSSFGVFLFGENIEVRLEEFVKTRLELADVLVGPINL
ncbi:MAG TPA: hypothetical protein VGK75_01355 [Casimicrobiaceae bacterium]